MSTNANEMQENLDKANNNTEKKPESNFSFSIPTLIASYMSPKKEDLEEQFTLLPEDKSVSFNDNNISPQKPAIENNSSWFDMDYWLGRQKKVEEDEKKLDLEKDELLNEKMKLYDSRNEVYEEKVKLFEAECKIYEEKNNLIHEKDALFNEQMKLREEKENIEKTKQALAQKEKELLEKENEIKKQDIQPVQPPSQSLFWQGINYLWPSQEQKQKEENERLEKERIANEAFEALKEKIVDKETPKPDEFNSDLNNNNNDVPSTGFKGVSAPLDQDKVNKEFEDYKAQIVDKETPRQDKINKEFKDYKSQIVDKETPRPEDNNPNENINNVVVDQQPPVQQQPQPIVQQLIEVQQQIPQPPVQQEPSYEETLLKAIQSPGHGFLPICNTISQKAKSGQGITQTEQLAFQKVQLAVYGW